MSKKKVVEEEAPTIAEETKPIAKQEAPAPRRTGASVAQASDDEVPRNEPGKKTLIVWGPRPDQCYRVDRANQSGSRAFAR